MRWLLFDLVAPMASFGGPAPGSIRDSERIPSRGALLGLVAAAVGIRRDEFDRLSALGESLRFASRVPSATQTRLLRDYHTAQAPKEPALKGRPRQTRRDELAVPRHELSTVLSDRYYYSDFVATIGVVDSAAENDLLRLIDCLRRPRFTLYLGRKSCPLAWPLDPHTVEADDWLSALAIQDASRSEQTRKYILACGSRELCWLPRPGTETLYSWDEHLPFGASLPSARLVARRDQPVDRIAWQFVERREWHAEGRSVGSDA